MALISLTAYKTEDNAVEIYVCRSNDNVHSWPFTVNRVLFYRHNMPVALFASIERECLAMLAGLNSTQFRTYSQYDGDDGFTYSGYVQLLLNIYGNDRKSRRKTSRTSWYRRRTCRGPNAWFGVRSIGLLSNALVDALVRSKLTTMMDNVVNAKALTRLSYSTASRLACFKPYRAINSSFNHAVAIIERTRIDE